VEDRTAVAEPLQPVSARTGDAWWRTAAGVILACLPAAAACATLSAAAVAVVRPGALDYAEPVVYGQALRITWGQSLYQPIDRPPLTVAAYTPLFYWIAAALQALVGPGFGPGRVLSLVCGAATAVMVGGIAGHRAGGAWVGVFAGPLFLALGFPRDRDDPPWLGLYRVDLLGVALSMAAIAVLSARRGTPSIVAAGVLSGLALLCKQTFVAALLAGAPWLFIQRPTSGAFVFVGVAAFTFAIPCFLLEATSGAFLQNTVEANLNPFYAVVAEYLLPAFVRMQWLPLLLAGIYLGLGRPWLSVRPRLLVLYWAASSLSLLGLGKIGAGSNYWIELAAATAILAARGAYCVVHLAKPGIAAAGTAALFVVVAFQLGGPPSLLASAQAVRSDARSLLAAGANVEFDSLVDRVRREPRDVLAEPMDVLVLAGRPVTFEPFIYSVRLDMGRWQPNEQVARICNGDVGLVVLGYSLEVGAGMTDGLHALWPPPVMAALRDSMAFEGIQAARYVYTPRPPSWPRCDRP